MVGLGGDEGFESWYRAEHPRLLAALTVATGDVEVAQDLVSEAFARALERWERVSAMASPGGWVREVAVNLLRRMHRRAALERRLLGRQRPAHSQSPFESIDPELWKAVVSLPPRQRAVLGLRSVLDLSQADTARLLGIRPGTVSATLVEARRRIIVALDREAHPVPSAEEVSDA
jgi:RNA polymerase sigma-70 factor (ECF subfamily)